MVSVYKKKPLDDREHVCQMCPDKRKFASSHQLKTHVNTVHIDGAHFQLCPECGNTYTTKRKLASSQRGPKACPVCCQRLAEHRTAAAAAASTSGLEFLEIPVLDNSSKLIPDLDCDICGRRSQWITFDSGHIVQIKRLGYEKKLQEKSEAAMITPLQRASKRAPT